MKALKALALAAAAAVAGFVAAQTDLIEQVKAAVLAWFGGLNP